MMKQGEEDEEEEGGEVARGEIQQQVVSGPFEDKAAIGGMGRKTTEEEDTIERCCIKLAVDNFKLDQQDLDLLRHYNYLPLGKEISTPLSSSGAN